MDLIKIGNIIIPVVVLLIIIYALKKNVKIYDSFVHGAKEGLELAVSILPYLVAMLFATDILLKSNILNHIFDFFNPILELIKVPKEILPMSIVRPISGNASFAVMIDLIKSYGPDSYIGRIASAIQGSTDTTIYVLSLYFGSVGIKKIKYSLWVGLLTNLTCLIVSIILVSIVFGTV